MPGDAEKKSDGSPKKAEGCGKPCFSEDAYSKKWDRCLADFAVRSSVGLLVGGLASLLLLRRKIWPVALGFGIGAGQGWANCSSEFRGPYYLRYDKIFEAKPHVPITAEQKPVDK